MFPIVRFYATESDARAAEAMLREARLSANVYVITPPTTSEYGAESSASASSADMANAIRAGGALRHPRQNQTQLVADALERGRSVVVVQPGYGQSAEAITLLGRANPVDMELVTVDRDAEKRSVRGRPDPFSDWLGLPTLTKGRSRTELASSNSYPTGSSLLINNASPLSSMFGLKTLTASKTNKTSSFGLPLLSGKAAPLSSMIGLPTLSKNGAPLSSLFRMKTLTQS